MSWTKEERADFCRQIGTLGGQETVRRYGLAHMRALGAAGFAAYVEKHQDGNRAAAIEGLRKAKPWSFRKDTP
jgi:hypothetical protein